MSRFNQAIHDIKIKNYHTPPVNQAQFDNPYLLKSDTQALNDILAHLQTPPPIQPTQPPPLPIQPTQPQSTLPGLTPTDTLSGLIPTEMPNPPLSGLTPTEMPNPQEAESGTGNQDNGPALPTSGSGNNIPSDIDWGNPEDPIPNPQDDMNLDETPTTPATTIIDNSPRGAGNTLQSRLAAHTAHYDGHTSASLAGRASNPNTRVTATHPPIVPATRLTNHVGVSNSVISSLYDALPADQRNKLNSRSGSTTLLNASTNPALHTLLPANFRDDKAIQQYRIRSNGNIYAYAYGTGNHPIYIGNWRESYAVTNPPFNQPTNPYDSASRPAPVSTVLGPQP